MDEKLRFVFAYERDEQSMTELCRQRGISRETAMYGCGASGIWRGGSGGTGPAPRRHGNHGGGGGAAVLELRQAHMRWGPRKLKRILARDQPGVCGRNEHDRGDREAGRSGHCGARSGGGPEPYTAPLGHAVESNRVWCADFKAGSVPGRSPRRSLTISDAWSGTCCAAKQWRRPTRSGCGPSSRRRSASTAAGGDSHRQRAPVASAAWRTVAAVGMVDELGYTPERIQAGIRSRTGATSACTARSSWK